MGDGSREGLLQVAEEPLMIEGSNMCPVDWTIQAARQAVTDDLHLLLPLLTDPDSDVRSVTAYVLAAATGGLSHVSSALQSRLAKEDGAVVRVGLRPVVGSRTTARGPHRRRPGLAVPGHRPRPRRAPRPPHRPRHPAPWLTWIDPTGVGLRSCIDDMVTTNIPELVLDDPWG
ncbi:hypothetical protein [Streptomyces sp. NPDC001601]|uniref:hypothetical protein n=1 Tax=Streptomyces sp. NPDC001601 TaxID=3364592 RepID=UPI00368EB2B8